MFNNIRQDSFSFGDENDRFPPTGKEYFGTAAYSENTPSGNIIFAASGKVWYLKKYSEYSGGLQ